LKENKLNIITDLLIDELKPERLILFGSRAKGTSFPNSDFDIAVESEKIDFRRKRIVKDKIRDVIGLHKFDLVFLNEVETEFKEIILKTGKVIYER